MIFKIFRPLMYLFYWASFCFKRDPKIWVFGGDYNSFSNGKYLAFYLKENHPDLQIIWIVRKHISLSKIREDGFKAFHHWSREGIKYSLKAKYQFLNSYIFDINYWLSGGSTITNLWHGVPLKKLNFDIEKGPSAKLFNPRFIPKWLAGIFILRYKSPHYFLATSEKTKEIFSRSFKVDKKNCLIAGYPRNDVFFLPEFSKGRKLTEKNKDLIKTIEKAKRTFIYMPTWRDSNNDFLTDSGIDFHVLNKLLKKKEYQFFIKLHPLTKIDNSIGSFSHIHFLESNFDTYPFLNKLDVLITDYSSIYIDFLLTEKGLIFFPFDIDRYKNQDRDLYFEYDDVTPGPKAYDFDELLSLIDEYQSKSKLYKERYNYAKTKDLFWKYHDGKSSERIANFFLSKES